MVFFSKTYRLAAFQSEDFFLTDLDQERMKIIDQQMEFLASFIGDGVVYGWEIADNSTTSEFSFSINSGLGFIEKYSIFTYGDIDFTLNDNTLNYIYLQKKNGVVGGKSGLSTASSILYIDPATTSDVVNLTIDDFDYNYIDLIWNTNPEPDIDYYLLERSLDNISWSEVAQPKTNSYQDTSVEDNTVYYYRIKAVDINGNESVSHTASSPTFVKTLKDLREPSDVPFVLKFPQDEQVQIVWDSPEGSTVTSYKIEYVRVDPEYNDIGSVLSETTTQTKIVIDSLSNDFVYRFTVYSLNEFGVQSQGVSVFSSPNASSGPSEVTMLDVADIESNTNDTGIALSISWENALGPYFLPSQTYEIIIIENGSIISRPIISTTTSKIIEVYVDENGLSRNIQPRTNYTILVKGINSSGNKNNGIIGTLETTNYKDPNKPFDLEAFENDNGDLIFVWKNSQSVFSYNEITLTSSDGTTTTVIESATNYGKANSYIIDFINTDLATTYTMSIRSIDEFSNASNYEEVSISTISGDELDLDPEVPNINSIYSNDKLVILSIDLPETEVQTKYLESFKVWRAPYSSSITASNFTLVDTISADSKKFEDYSVSNDQGYVYFLTSVDRYGNESLNPIDNGFISYNYYRAYPHPNISFASPGNVSVSSSDYNAIISWNPTSDSFDGYEILRSKGDQFNYETIGSVTKEIGYFVDENALLEDGETYYYAIRKYRNEARLISSLSSSTPDASLLLGTIEISNGSVTIENLARDISNMQIASLDNVSEIIDNHTHSLTSFNDLRVDLSENVIIDDWTTSNNLVFTTTQDLTGASSFIVRINGNLPSVFYSINSSNSTLTFSSAVTGTVTVEAVGVNETQNLIQSERVQKTFPSQIESGTILYNQFDTYSHLGRIGEDANPLQFKMDTQNNYKYEISQNKYVSSQEVVSSGIVFYDIIAVGDVSFLSWALLTYPEWEFLTYTDWFFLELSDVASFVAATSQGLMISFDRGKNWQVLRFTNYAAHKIFYADVLGAYFALSGNDVYYSKNGISYVKMNGLENSSFCKDITEDELGNIYMSTDIGVFTLDQSDLGDQLVWQHASFTNAESSDCYGVWYDAFNNELLLSNQSGLYKSADDGVTWSLSNAIEADGVIHYFHEEVLEYVTYIYAVSDNCVWRKESQDLTFEKIADLNYDLRKMDVFEGRIVLTSSDGFLISKPSYDPYSDTGIEFNKLELLDINNNRAEATLIAELSGRLYLGTDNKLSWTTDFNYIFGSYTNENVVSPTVFVNGKKQTIGVYYSDNEVFFDKPVKYEDNVSVANQYVTYYLENKGWVDQNFQSDVRVYKNNELVATLEETDFNFTTDQFNNAVFETFTTSTYAVATAQEALDNYNSELSKAVAHLGGDTTALDETETIESVTANIVRFYYKVYSSKFGNVKFYSTITIDNEEYYVIDNELVLGSAAASVYPEYSLVEFLPSIITQYQNNIQIDSMNGTFGFLSEQNKYDRVQADIKNCYFYNGGINTHVELEDNFEIINSGLSSSISQRAQVNLLKQGMFIEKTFGKTHTAPIDDCEYAVPLQASYIIVDNSSWYDSLNSTVDYTEELSNNTINTSISYPMVVKHVSSLGEIWVGGLEGLISIDTTTDDVSVIDFNQQKLSEEVRDIFISGSTIYIICPQNIYYTTDNGVTWNSLFTGGIKGRFEKFTKIKNNLVVFSSLGIYYKNNAFSEWQLASNTITGVDIVNNSDLIYAFVNNQMYTSTNGVTWTTKTDFEDLDVNSIKKYRGIFLAATGEGLRSDGATFYGNTSYLSVIDIASDISISEIAYMNDVDVDSDNQIILAGQNDGSYWILSSGIWTKSTDSYLDTIHKVLLIDQQPWLFGYNMFKSPNKLIPLRLVEASPL